MMAAINEVSPPLWKHTKGTQSITEHSQRILGGDDLNNEENN